MPLAGFLKRNCCKFLAISFPIINQDFFVAIISFSLIIVIFVIIIIMFLIFILFISMYFQFIIIWYFIKYYFIIFLFIFLSFYLFLILSSFFSIFLHLFTFLSFSFLLCFKWVLIKDMCFICILLFLVLSLLHGLLNILREERQDYPIYRENSSPFGLCCCVIRGQSTWQFTLSPSTLSSLSF